MNSLLLGDSHVLSLQPFLAPHVHCESQPSWSTERFLREQEWAVEPVLHEGPYATCVLLLGANDVSMPVEETLENLQVLRRLCLQHATYCLVLGYPGLKDPLAKWKTTFGDDFVPAPPAEFGEDHVHLTEACSRLWADTVNALCAI